MKLQHTVVGFAVAALLALSLPSLLPAQTLTVQTTCAATVTVDPATKPTSQHWILEVLINNAVVWRTTTGPWTKVLSGPAGLYQITARWVRMGQAPKALDGFTVTCHPAQATRIPAAPPPPPPPPPPVGVAPQITAFAADATSIPLGQSVKFTWTVTGTPPPTITLSQQGGQSGTVTAPPYVFTPTTVGDKIVTISAVNSVGAATPRSWTVRVTAGTTPPPAAATD